MKSTPKIRSFDVFLKNDKYIWFFFVCTYIIFFQVSSMELVQEIHQLLMDREETCHRTCFSLQLNGNTLDNFAELKSIEGLTDGVDLKVVEEPYTVCVIIL